ncbi:MAG TPA: FAD-dependent oxidoreductase [bacterium]|nr:FAD-dependent oxidoreductase [bacterium]
MYDTIIIGGGPAGVSAGIYAARKKMKTLFITENFGGQSTVSTDIGNWIGHVSISGLQLAKSLEAHLKAQEDIEIKEGERAELVVKTDAGFQVKTNKGAYDTKTVIVCSGARHRQLNVPGEQEFSSRGVAYCSTCDAPLFRGRAMAVIGGGNSGLEAVADLIPYATEIYLLNYTDKIKGDQLTLDKIQASDKFKGVIYNAETLEITGDKTVTGLKYKDRLTGEEKTLAVQGVFVEIGAVPNSELVKNLVELNSYGEIIIDHRTATASAPGIFAAGDVTDEAFKQNNISAGDGVKAALSAYQYLQGK